MSVSLPNGATLKLAASYGAAKPITAITNANPAVASAVAHGFTAGAILEVTSGWPKLNGRAVRVGAAPATDTFKLENFDSSDASLFPTASAPGSARAVLTWVDLPQVLEFSTSGGDAQFASYQFLESDTEQQIPSGFSAMTIQVTIADDPTLSCYPVLRAASIGRKPIIMLLTLPNGSQIPYNCYVSFNDTPTLSKGNVMSVKPSFALIAQPVRY